MQNGLGINESMHPQLAGKLASNGRESISGITPANSGCPNIRSREIWFGARKDGG